MKIALVFLLGIVFGIWAAYFFRRKRKTASIATDVQNQQNQRQTKRGTATVTLKGKSRI